MLDLLIALFRNGQIEDEGIQEEVDTFMFEVFIIPYKILAVFSAIERAQPCKRFYTKI